jgi:hypothetical protein
LAEACLKVDWNGLPVERDPSKTEYKTYGGYGGDSRYGWDAWDDYDYYPSNSRWGNNTTTKKYEPKTDKVWFHDKKYNYVSNVEIESLTKKVVSVDLCKERVAYEKMIIENLLTSLDLQYNSFDWDGFKLKVAYKQDAGDHTTECNRNDLLEYLPELDYSKGDDLGSDSLDNYFNASKYKREQELKKSLNEDFDYSGYADFD